MSLKKGQVSKGPNSPLVFKWRGKTSHLEKRLFSAKVSKTSFFKPIDLKLFQEGKKETRPDVQQQPELDSMSPEFRWEVLGVTDVEIHC